MDKSEFKKRKKRILSRFRQAKSRILHGNNEDGFASPIFDTALALRELQKERQIELAKLYREFYGLDPDPFDDEFNKFEKLLNEKYHGDIDNLYRIEYGYPHGKPNKVGVYVDPRVCAKCGRVRCICKDNEKSSDMEWLRMGKQ